MPQLPLLGPMLSAVIGSEEDLSILSILSTYLSMYLSIYDMI